MADMEADVRYIKGIGEKKSLALKRLGINSINDLINYFPLRYEDRTQFKDIADISNNECACIKALVADSPRLEHIRSGLDIVKFRIVDDSGSVDIVYYNMSYIKNTFHKGETCIFYGKIVTNGSKKSMTNPIFENSTSSQITTGRIVPIYHLTKGITQKVLSQAIRQAMEVYAPSLSETLPYEVVNENNLCSIKYAYHNIHYPEDFRALEIARKRLVFEELFTLACAMGLLNNDTRYYNGIKANSIDFDEFYQTLQFSPTNSQKEAIFQAYQDMSSGKSMNRLILGDVGCGKTLIAAALIWYTWKNGYCSAFMAPTELLVEQHFHTLTDLLNSFGISVHKLTSSMSLKEKRNTKKLLAEGKIDLIIGTQALFSKDVEYKNLGLVITDEQHRFGVEQRSALITKGTRPHVLVMSATPIPRTLALIIYGDLDVSTIKELPPGRQKVETFFVNDSYRQRLYSFIMKLVSEGQQVYVICPIIEDKEDQPSTMKSAKEHAEELKRNLPELSIACIHGKLKTQEKDSIMEAFVEGNIDILVSTTVIEVGVNVPNASLIIIENAERFGLSQLHQLRGRVGRGTHQSYCILVSDTKSEESKARLKIMTEIDNGFEISEKDLKLRGPGDFFGSRQHGLPKMHIANLGADMDILALAQNAAKKLLNDDPDISNPKNQSLNKRINTLFNFNSDRLN